MSDEELIKRCLRQDSAAQKALYDRFASQMMALCLRYAGNPMEAQDMLQEGFIKVFEKLGQYRGAGPFGGWIRRVMVNESLIYIRKMKKHQFAEEIDDDRDDGVLEANVFDQLATQDILQLIAKLPEGYRTVFNLFAVEGFSHKEIAEMLEITESTSKTQFHKAKRQLRKQLEEIEKKSE